MIDRRRVAGSILDYEQSLFGAKNGYWRDLRDLSTQVEFGGDPVTRVKWPTAWCHGAVGIGITRLQASPHLNMAAPLAAAVADTLLHGFGTDHSLCHGDAGSLDFLQLAADGTGDPALRDRVRRQATTMLDSIDRAGWHCGLRPEIETPGLLTGLAGIGYGMLRLLAPDRVPSVLAQEPPRL